MTTMRELVDAGFSMDTHIVVRRHEDSNVAYEAIPSKHLTAGRTDLGLIVFDIANKYVALGDDEALEY